MKKIIILVTMLIILTSCTPKIENPSDALEQNQQAILKNIEKLNKLTSKEGNSNGDFSIAINSKEADMEATAKYDFNFQNYGNQIDSNVKIDFNTEIKNKNLFPVKNISGNVDLNLISLKDKVFFKLNEFKINNIEKISELSMITDMISPFIKKWYFIDLPKDENNFIDTDLLIQSSKGIINILQKNTILEFVKENENENFYDYDVKINSKNVISINEQFLQLIEQKDKLTEENKLNIESDIKRFNENIKINIKIDKKDLDFFTIKFTSKQWTLIIENKENQLNISFSDNINYLSFEFLWKKSFGKLEWTIILKEGKKELFNWNISFKSNWKKTNILFEWIVKDNWEELKIKLSLNDKITKKSIQIEEPKNSEDFKNVLYWIMWIEAPVEQPVFKIEK